MIIIEIRAHIAVLRVVYADDDVFQKVGLSDDGKNLCEVVVSGYPIETQKSAQIKRLRNVLDRLLAISIKYASPGDWVNVSGDLLWSLLTSLVSKGALDSTAVR